MQIAQIGTGYVGLTTGVTLAFLGHRVTCVDVDECRIAALCEGRLPFYEPWLREMFNLVRENLDFTTDYAQAIPAADVVFITVGTPSGADGQPDLSFLREAARGVGNQLARDFTVVVNKSTVPVGSGNWVEALLRDAFEARNGSRPKGARFSVVSNPEFLRQGAALHDSLFPDRIVIGSDDGRSIAIMHELYRPLIEQTFAAPAFLPRPENFQAVPLITTELASAELVKYAANAFLSLKISFINEIAELSERVGGDIGQVARAIGLDRRIGPRFLEAGIGWGGSCFGKDTGALLSMGAEYGVALPIVAATRHVNYRQRDRVIERLQGLLKIVKGRSITLLGATFKAHTDDLRDSPSIDIARRLAARGAWVRVHDPVAASKAARELETAGVACFDSVADAVDGADALVLATEWPEYRELPWTELAATMRTPLILDGRNFLDEKKLTASGFRYHGVGR
jgi:UDPglucose 6-dehydrogenase